MRAYAARSINEPLWRRCDWWLLACALAPALLSLPTIYSATYVAEGGGNPWHYVNRQVFSLLAGVLGLLLANALDYHYFPDLSRWFYGLALAGLVLVLLCGREVNGAKAWFNFGPLALQPSEPAKVAVLIALAKWFGQVADEDEATSARSFWSSAWLVGVPVGLILLQPDFGTTLTFGVMWLAMYWWSGAPLRTIIGLLLLAVLAFALAWHLGVLADYQKNRVTVLFNPEIDPRGVGYNLRQSLVAVGSGGWFGKGWLQGTQTHLRFLPERHTDFIFAVWCEERGLLGAALLLALYAALFWRLWDTILVADDAFGRQLVVGCGAMLLFHVVLNVGMVIGALPITGLPLPFFSYGGSNLLTSCVLLGIAVNVRTRRRGAAP